MTNCGCLELSRVDDQKGITQHTRYYRIPTPREFSPSNHIAIILESLLERRRWFILLITFLCWSKDSLSDSYCVNYSQDVSVEDLLPYDVSIIHPEVKVDLDVLHSVGQKVFAYISVGEVADDASYRKTVQDLGVRFLTRNPIWNSDIVDLSDPRWRVFIVEQLARDCVSKGFDGFFLDTMDSVETDSLVEP